jgi:hypothetical protein
LLNYNISDNISPDGICSVEYEKYLPCYDLSYKKYSANANFITLLEIGEHDKKLSGKYNNNEILVNTNNNNYKITLKDILNDGEVVKEIK